MDGGPLPSDPAVPAEMSVGQSTRGVAAPPTDGDPIQRASLRRNFATMGVAQIVSWLFATVTAILIPRYLGPELQGRIHLVTSIWGLAGVLIAFGTGRFLQVVLARDQRHGLGFVAPVLAMRVGWFVVCGVVIATVAVVIDVDRTTVLYGVLIGAATLLAKVRDTFESAFAGVERMSSIAKVGMIAGTVTVVGTVAVLAGGLGAKGLLTFNLVNAAVWAVVVARMFTRLTRLDWSSLGSRTRGALLGGAPFVIVTLAVALYREIDVIVIAKVAGDRDLGWYTAADRLSGSIMFPVTLTLGVLFPTLGRLWATDRAAFERLLQRTFSLLLLIGVPIGLGVVAVGPQLSGIMFGDDFSGTGVLLAIFGPVTIVTMATTLLANVALVSNRQRFLSILILGCAALTVPLDIVLVQWAAERFDNGAIGGMVTFAITELVQFLVSLSLATYLLNRSVVLWLVRVLAAGGLMLVAVWPLRDEFILLPIGVGAVVYPLLVVVLRALDEDQRQMILEVVQQMRGGAGRR